MVEKDNLNANEKRFFNGICRLKEIKIVNKIINK